MFQSWETFIGVIVGLAILIPYLLKKYYWRFDLTSASGLDMSDVDEKLTPNKRREHPVFTLFVRAGYIVLFLSTISWIVYIEFIL